MQPRRHTPRTTPLSSDRSTHVWRPIIAAAALHSSAKARRVKRVQQTKTGKQSFLAPYTDLGFHPFFHGASWVLLCCCSAPLSGPPTRKPTTTSRLTSTPHFLTIPFTAITKIKKNLLYIPQPPVRLCSGCYKVATVVKKIGHKHRLTLLQHQL